MITPGLIRVVYEQQEKDLLEAIEMKRMVAEARERDAKANGKAPLKDQNRPFVQVLSEKIFSRPSATPVLPNPPECAAACPEKVS
ncbi:MAG TPA: hypothetical protein VMT46_17250 [Anaerolineaceae bacterium]|nr:hypothetical protein [Anaerolineaceae bacterium]